MKEGKRILSIILFGMLLLSFGIGDMFFLYEGQKSFQIKYTETKSETEQKNNQEEKSEEKEVVYTSSLESFIIGKYDTKTKEGNQDNKKDIQKEEKTIELDGLYATASSELPSSGDNTYYASNMLDNNLGTAWVEGVKGNGEGEEFTISSEQPIVIKEIVIFNGYQKNKDVLERNAQIKKIIITASDGSTKTVSLKKVKKCGTSETINFDTENNGVTEVKFKIVDTYSGKDTTKGSKASDTCVSEVRLYGYIQ